MSEPVASLIVEVDARDAPKAAMSLNDLAKAADKAETASEDLASTAKKAAAATREAAAAAQSAVVPTKALNQATLNLGRQFSDIGTQLAGGQSPFLILIQQGPQIADAFAVASAQGLGFKAVVTGMVAEIRALLVTFAPWIAGFAAVGGAVALLVKAHNDHMKRIEELNKGIDTMAKKLADTVPYLDQFTAQERMAKDGSAAFYDWLEKKAKGMANYAANTRAATLAILNQQSIEAAANAQKLRDENLKTNARGATVYTGKGSLFGGVNSAGYQQYIKDQEKADRAAATAQKLLAEAMKAPNEAFIAQEAGASRATKAIREHTKAIEVNTDTVAASNAVWPEALAIAQAYEAQQKALRTAANDNIKTFDAMGVKVPSTLENVAAELEKAASKARDFRYDVEDIAYAIKNNDWTTAFAGLASVLVKVKAAFAEGATAADKFAAAAGVAQGIGNAIGGSTGAAISGAASGALAGFTTFGLPGAIIGGIGGLVSSIFGSSKAKKQAKAQAAAQAAAAEAQRQQQISDQTYSINVALLQAQGKAEEALAMTRQHELDALAKLDPSLVELQKQLYAAQDAADAAAKAAEKLAEVEKARKDIQDRIDALTMTTAELLAKSRSEERAAAVALDASLGELLDKLYGLEDAATAAAAAQAAAAEQAAAAAAEADALSAAQAGFADAMSGTTSAVTSLTSAYEDQASAIGAVLSGVADTITSMKTLAQQLRDFASSVNTGELSALDQKTRYAASKNALLAAVSSGDASAITSAASAFLSASKASATSSASYRQDVALVRSLALAKAAGLDSQVSAIGSVFAGLPRFASGGSIVLGGYGGTDTNTLSLNGQPIAAVTAGETMSISPKSANDNSEIAALRQQVASLEGRMASLLDRIAGNGEKIERLLTNVTEGGRAMQTEAYA